MCFTPWVTLLERFITIQKQLRVSPPRGRKYFHRLLDKDHNLLNGVWFLMLPPLCFCACNVRPGSKVLRIYESVTIAR